MSYGSRTRIREKSKKGNTTLNYHTNQNGCARGAEARNGICSCGRTPWGTREAGSCGRRPWSTRTETRTCGEARSACPSAANTTWKNRGAGCACEGTARSNGCGTTPIAGNFFCGSPDQSRRNDSVREGECDEDCNRGATDTGILEGKSLAMVYSPYQNFTSLYDPRQGLCHGTIFTGLNKPFHGDGRGC